MFSPDGDWLAYMSNESKQDEVYVRPFMKNGPPEQVSIGGIASYRPIWANSTKELVFATMERVNSMESQVYIASYQVANSAFIPGDPVPWPGGTFYQRTKETSYDLHPDGKRILVRKLSEIETNEQQTFDHVVLFENFFNYLREKLPTNEE